MSINSPFLAQGKTVRVAASGAANTQSAVVTLTSDSPCNQYYVANADKNFSVYVKISSSSSINVSLPDVASDYVLALPPYGSKVISGPNISPSANAYARVIGDGNDASCYITPGTGV